MRVHADSEGTHERSYTETALIEHLQAANDAYQHLPTIADLEQYNDEWNPDITSHPQTPLTHAARPP